MSLFVLILGMCCISIIVMMMTFPGFLKKPYAPLCDNFCSDKNNS